MHCQKTTIFPERPSWKKSYEAPKRLPAASIGCKIIKTNVWRYSAIFKENHTCNLEHSKRISRFGYLHSYIYKSKLWFCHSRSDPYPLKIKKYVRVGRPSHSLRHKPRQTFPRHPNTYWQRVLGHVLVVQYRTSGGVWMCRVLRVSRNTPET